MFLAIACPFVARLYEPIPLPKDRNLATLRDAAFHITKLPKAEHDALSGKQRWKRYCSLQNMTGRQCLRGLLSCER